MGEVPTIWVTQRQAHQFPSPVLNGCQNMCCNMDAASGCLTSKHKVACPHAGGRGREGECIRIKKRTLLASKMTSQKRTEAVPYRRYKTRQGELIYRMVIGSLCQLLHQIEVIQWSERTLWPVTVTSLLPCMGICGWYS
jgi:hypothetical protein